MATYQFKVPEHEFPDLPDSSHLFVGVYNQGTIIHELHADDVEVSYQLHKGSPAETILEVSIKDGVDLIVMCTDGRDNIKDFVTGTITEHVINNSPCPVLVIPIKG